MNPLIKLAHKLDAVLVSTSRVLNIIGITCMMVLMLLTVSDVVMRYIFNQPIRGSVELTEYLMAVVGFFGLAWCAIHKGHAMVDLFVARFFRKTRAAIDSVTFFLALTVVPLVAWQGLETAYYAHQIGTHSFMLKIPTYPFVMALGVGFLVLSLVLFAHMVKSIAKVIQK